LRAASADGSFVGKAVFRAAAGKFGGDDGRQKLHGLSPWHIYIQGACQGETGLMPSGRAGEIILPAPPIITVSADRPGGLQKEVALLLFSIYPIGMYDFRKIEAFCRVYEQRSFSKAGEVLFLSQPTISSHVRTLETDMGVRLLERLGRTVLPSPAGVVLYERSIRALGELEAARNEISVLLGEVAGEVVLGASTIPAGFILPGVVTSFIRQYPKSSLRLAVKDSRAVIRDVLNCEVMLGVAGSMEKHPDLKFTHLLDDETIIVCSPNFYLYSAGSGIFSLEDVSGWPWIFRNEGSGTRKSFEEVVSGTGYCIRDFKIKLKVDSAQAAVQYAAAGLGVTFASRLAVADMLKTGELAEINIEGLRLPRAFYAVQNLRRGFFPVVAGFLSHLLGKTAHFRNPEQAENHAFRRSDLTT
jgi:DNA-binding transcriptional LysR family regulator